jgi:Holliday junction DNA helicase RuvB
MSNIRPSYLQDLLGQRKTVEALQISVKSAIKRDDSLGHVLFYGPPGVGKTTISTALANEMDKPIQIANGANLRTIKSLLPYLMRITEGSLFFVDEIHRMTSIVEEFLYPVMEDFRVDMPNANSDSEEGAISIEIPQFTFVGATTEFGSLSKPLIDRFKHKFVLTLYNNVDLLQIAKKRLPELDLQMTDAAVNLAVNTSRGTPRILHASLEWLRDYHLARGGPRLSEGDVEAAMEMRGIDRNGLTDMDRSYLKVLKNSGKPMGIETICSLCGIDRTTVEGIIEPWLLQKGKVAKTPKGRIAL